MPRPPSNRDIERIARMVLDLIGRGRRGHPASPSFNPRTLALALALLLVLAAIAWLISPDRERPRVTPGAEAPGAAEDLLFVSWNVENFFDDRDDPNFRDDDEDWFGNDPAAFARKVRALRDATLLYNEGRGPDVLAMVEVESRRCVEALRDALNERLPEPWRYTGIVQVDDRTGRHFAPAILTRLAVRDDLTRGPRDFGNRRILEAHLELRGVPLVVLEAHWTSRLRGEEATRDKREAYARQLYDRYLSLRRENPGVDVILAGDFNDEPEDPSLQQALPRRRRPGPGPRGGRGCRACWTWLRCPAWPARGLST